MEIAYILTAASAIAVTAIYFFFVRKPSIHGGQTQSFPEVRDGQQ